MNGRRTHTYKSNLFSCDHYYYYRSWWPPPLNRVQSMYLRSEKSLGVLGLEYIHIQRGENIRIWIFSIATKIHELYSILLILKQNVPGHSSISENVPSLTLTFKVSNPDISYMTGANLYWGRCTCHMSAQETYLFPWPLGGSTKTPVTVHFHGHAGCWNIYHSSSCKSKLWRRLDYNWVATRLLHGTSVAEVARWQTNDHKVKDSSPGWVNHCRRDCR